MPDELKPILCSKCNDHLIANDGAICEVCAATLESIISELQKENAELNGILKFCHEQIENGETGRVRARLRMWKMLGAMPPKEEQ